ncbi:hypothetical protein TIFTF001_027582 [Ficus carica]|uniref:RNase H type-1 domain-containing protein n=1 Tax=Ficus carica TaxID=3494 RepID=A0AA88DN78_FICCA|nr:hypothetical protein TIFTF001_027582 [Ficus carica]
MARLAGRLRLSTGSLAGAVLSDEAPFSGRRAGLASRPLGRGPLFDDDDRQGWRRGGGTVQFYDESVVWTSARAHLQDLFQPGHPLPSPAGRRDETARCARRLGRRLAHARPRARTPRDIHAPRQSVILGSSGKYSAAFCLRQLSVALGSSQRVRLPASSSVPCGGFDTWRSDTWRVRRVMSLTRGGCHVSIPGTVHLYTIPDWSDLHVDFSAWRVLGAPSAEQILKPSLSKPNTLGTEYQTGLAPTSIPGPYSASNPGLGIGHVDDPPTADATHLLLSPVKSPPAANHSDGHCCPFTADAHGTLPLTAQDLGPCGIHLLGHFLADLSIKVSMADTTPVSPSFRDAPILQVIDCGATGEFQLGNPDHIGCYVSVNAVLFREANKKQKAIFYDSKMMTDAEKRYAILSMPYLTGRLTKWAIELGVYDIYNKQITFRKGQVLAGFISECTKLGKTEPEIEEQEEETWELHVYELSNQYGARIGIALNKDLVKLEYLVRLGFEVTNNVAEYEALLLGLKLAISLGTAG